MRTAILLVFFFFLFTPGISAQTGGAEGSWGSVPSSQTSGTGTGGGSQSGGVGIGGRTGIELINPLKSGTSLSSFLNSILDFVIKIGSIVIVFMTIFAGFKFVVARGVPAKIEEAKLMLFWILVGALILLGAKGISLGILSTVQSLGG